MATTCAYHARMIFSGCSRFHTAFPYVRVHRTFGERTNEIKPLPRPRRGLLLLLLRQLAQQPTPMSDTAMPHRGTSFFFVCVEGMEHTARERDSGRTYFVTPRFYKDPRNPHQASRDGGPVSFTTPPTQEQVRVWCAAAVHRFLSHPILITPPTPLQLLGIAKLACHLTALYYPPPVQFV